MVGQSCVYLISLCFHHNLQVTFRLETVEGKVMAIDSSIWIYQFQATMRDKDGRALLNAHVLGFLRRISKLLFYGIKPVFVFDGGAPALKRSTLVWPNLFHHTARPIVFFSESEGKRRAERQLTMLNWPKSSWQPKCDVRRLEEFILTILRM